MRIIFMLGKEFTKRDAHRFGVAVLREHGCQVEIWEDNLKQRLQGVGHGDFVITDFNRKGNYKVTAKDMVDLLAIIEKTPMPFGLLIGNALPQLSFKEKLVYYIRSYIAKTWRVLRRKCTVSQRVR